MTQAEFAAPLVRLTATLPQFQGNPVLIDGRRRLRRQHGLIADYAESVDGGVAMVRLGMAPARMETVLRKSAGRLQERPSSRDFLAKKIGA